MRSEMKCYKTGIIRKGKGLAKSASDIALGTHSRTGENVKNRQFTNADDALRNIGKEKNRRILSILSIPLLALQSMLL